MSGLGPSEMIVIVVALAVVAALAYRALRVDDTRVAVWEASAGMQAPEKSRPILRRYLASSRLLRSAGALVALMVGLAYTLITDESGPLQNPLVFVLVGYLVGAVVSEVAFRRPERQTGAALLAPRQLADYLPGYVLVLQRGLALVSVLLVIVYVLPSYPRRVSLQPTVTGFLAYGAAGLLIAAVIEAFQRMVVSRRQPITNEGGLELDDALRSYSVNVLAGAGVGLLLIVIGAEVAVFAQQKGFLEWPLWFLSMFLYFSALFFWLDLTKPHGFKVRRGTNHGASA